jgi:hypothetical protein
MSKHTISTGFYRALQSRSKIRVYSVDIVEARSDFDDVRAGTGESFGQDNGEEDCESLGYE